jgi:hypothetical protein
MADRVDALKQEIRSRSRGRLDLVAFAVSPDGRWAATLLRVRATGYWLESLYEYGPEGWTEHTTSNGSLAYNSTGEDECGNSVGVLRFYGDARRDSRVVLIQWRDAVHEVPVQNGHFAFAEWDATEDEVDALPAAGPTVVGFR